MLYSNSLHASLDSIFNEVFYNFPKETKPPSVYSMTRDGNGAPISFQIQLALAGFRKEDVTVSWEGRELYIEGDNLSNPKVLSKFQNSFSWKIPVADNIDLDNLAVDFSEGLLTLNIPIKIPAKNRRFVLGEHRTKTKTTI